MQFFLYKLILLIFCLLLSIVGCVGEKMDENRTQYNKLTEVAISSWEDLEKKKIFFGHQSVGYNIIDGTQEILDAMNKSIYIFDISHQKDFPEKSSNFFEHSRIGNNNDPKSKINAFVDAIRNKTGEHYDIAFFKFCYVDINKNTDVDALFKDYRETMLKLEQEFPKTVFFHVTTPLTQVQIGIKAWVKKIIGRPIGGYDDNIKRNYFNSLLRNEYSIDEQVFDLAKIESTKMDGTRAIFKFNDQVYYTLDPDYSDDGGHLNEKGRERVAEQLLLMLLRIASAN